MKKILGVQTADFAAYYDLVQALRAHELAFVPLGPDDAVPPHVSVLIVTGSHVAGEAGSAQVVLHVNVEQTMAEILRILHGPGPFRQCVIGIDPGERPGVAALADGRVLRLVHAPHPEAVRSIVEQTMADVRAERFIVRVGNGAPTLRDRTLQTLGGLEARLELVDEHRSTPVGLHGNALRDTAAATRIALTPGLPLLPGDVRPVVPTPGELRDIQRKSRLASEGTLTINRALARHVALGRLTLDQALDQMRQKA